MKSINLIPTIILLIMAGCTGNQQQTDGLITVDVTKSYPKKEMILQDFLDVEYIPLETSDEFLTQGLVWAAGKEVVIIRNALHDGEVFLFDRTTGKALRKINRKGQGSEEYTFILGITLDEDKDEIFVHDFRKTVVYDLEGNFRRSLNYKAKSRYDHIYNFDSDNLICYDSYVSNDGTASNQSFYIISKQNGSIVREIQIPFEKKIVTSVVVKDEAGMTWGAYPSNHYPIIPYFDKWILSEVSSDTIYAYSPDHRMMPLITRTPSVQSMNPEVFLFPSVFTDRYSFMESVKKEYDFKQNTGYPGVDLIYDKQDKFIAEYTVYNDDDDKKPVFMKLRPVNSEIASARALQAPDIIEAYEKGQLKGKLKEIAATLNEESNPVIMLAKYKK
ncbi:MAG: 6-bladed beta-propeller [Tannerellaceae bacterium]|jgi:hypothetical protein|nr:6-bladed beta-propeller [Tannerellaceae bacterium]